MFTTHQFSLFLTLILHLLNFSQSKPLCIPSACGSIREIRSSFRLKGDSKNCGYNVFGSYCANAELACENNVTSISLNSHKYYVKAINYTTSTIRLVDASINNDDICSFPTVSSYAYNFTNPSGLFYMGESYPVNFISCPNPLNKYNSSLYTHITTQCQNSSSNYYIKIGHMNASEVLRSCRVDLIVMTSSPQFKDFNNVSLSQIHQSLLYGFELGFRIRCSQKLTIWEILRKYFYSINGLLLIPLAILVFLIAGLSLPLMIIIVITGVLLLWFNFWAVTSWMYASPQYDEATPTPIGLISSIVMEICVSRFIICPLLVGLLIYKFRRRHFSVFDAIEGYLQSDNKLSPIRYSYSDLKKMTAGFREKLGQGGYGSVYKGKLRSGHHVAVKLLEKSKANGQDFINEIATIGRIHHVNVVKLVGYCAERSKRALVFDFMPNGSLEKYICTREKTYSLDWDMKFKIAVEVARGIEYLHCGCDIQILHFDIKPHNILLDDKFVPKISDFGLAKLCSVEKETVTLTAARGTIGYVAPELINRSIGAVSYKADVYSFGMLLMEMVDLNRDLKSKSDDSSMYFPYWIYECFNQGKEIEIEKAEENNGDNDENGSRKSLVRKMTIVALWCIQMNPDDRPSMNKVLGMLEGDVERLQIPEYPSQSVHMVVNKEESWGTSATDSVSLLHDNSGSNFEITIA